MLQISKLSTDLTQFSTDVNEWLGLNSTADFQVLMG